jgi:hypothetical protein
MQSKIVALFNLQLLVFIVLFIAGCSGSSVAPASKPKVIPAWINSPLPNDNDDYMYGMAIDVDRQSAIKSALNDMVSKLGTTIESTYESNQEVQGAYSKLTVNAKIKADVSKIKINNYKVIKSYKISYREFAVMIETDKKKFVNGLKEFLKQEQKSIFQEYKALSGRDSLTRYNKKKNLAKRAKSLLSTILIISELDKNFDKKSNLDFILKLQKEFLNESKSLKFYVVGNKASLKFVDKIKNYLARHGFSVVNSRNNSIKIEINTSHNISKRAIPIAVLNLNVSVYEKNVRIGGKNIIIKERYNGSLESVYKNASIDLEEDIKDKGINEVIGINLVL